VSVLPSRPRFHPEFHERFARPVHCGARRRRRSIPPERLARDGAWALLLALGVLGCPDRPFIVHVSYPGTVAVAEGADVVYEGVTVGQVTAKSLRQESPGDPAQVQLTLSIQGSTVTLREGDRFEVTSAHPTREPFVQISPAGERSKPLESGAIVAGVPPLVTQVEDSLGAAIEAITEIASEKAHEVLEEIARSLEEAAEELDRQRTPAPGPPGQPDP